LSCTATDPVRVGKAVMGVERQVMIDSSRVFVDAFHVKARANNKKMKKYTVQTACDKNGWILGYSVYPGNHHDSRTFKSLYDKIKDIGIETLIADAGYKTPGIAKLLIDDGIRPLLPYRCPMTKEGFFKKYGYVYDEYYDCYICPNNQVLSFRTTNRNGYGGYKSCGTIFAGCPSLAQCTRSRNHVKVVTRHIWEPYMGMCEDIRHTLGMKDLYLLRKETIERIFGKQRRIMDFGIPRCLERPEWK